MRAKPQAKSWPQPTTQPTMATCVTRKIKFDDRRVFDEGKCFQNLMVFVQEEFRQTLTAQLEKLYVDNAAELCSRLTSFEKLSPTTNSWTSLTTVIKFVL